MLEILKEKNKILDNFTTEEFVEHCNHVSLRNKKENEQMFYNKVVGLDFDGVFTEEYKDLLKEISLYSSCIKIITSRDYDYMSLCEISKAITEYGITCNEIICAGGFINKAIKVYESEVDIFIDDDESFVRLCRTMFDKDPIVLNIKDLLSE